MALLILALLQRIFLMSSLMLLLVWLIFFMVLIKLLPILGTISHTLGASLNIRHNLSSSKGPKPLQLKLLTTYIPKTSAFTLAFSTSQRLRTTRASARTFFTFRHYITPSARNF